MHIACAGLDAALEAAINHVLRGVDADQVELAGGATGAARAAREHQATEAARALDRPDAPSLAFRAVGIHLLRKVPARVHGGRLDEHRAAVFAGAGAREKCVKVAP
jgi:hypothetical protein